MNLPLDFKYNRFIGYISLFFLILLLVCIWLSPQKLIYDEFYFMMNIIEMKEKGIGLDFIKSMHHQSPGPLYQYVHAIHGWVSDFDIVWMRVFNFILFIGCLYFTYLILKIREAKDAYLKSLSYFINPIIYIVVALALTEVPAMLFVLISIFFFQYVMIRVQFNSTSYYILLLLSAIFLSLSIIGRTPYLMILCAVPLLMNHNFSLTQVFFYILIASIIPLILFTSWGGWVSKDLQSVQSGYNLEFGSLAVGYHAVFTWLICPNWYNFSWRQMIYMIGVLIFFVVLNINTQLLFFEPFKDSVERLPFTIPYYGYVMPSALLLIGFIFLWASWYKYHLAIDKKWFLFCFVSGMLILLTTIKSTAQFSSRYVLQSLPLFILIYQHWIRFDLLKLLMLCISGILGLYLIFNQYIHY